MNDSFPQAIWRMDWGFGNPNKTAALIATVMIAIWALAYLRKWGFWAALPLFTGFGVCLILTQSRGGAVGLMFGSSIVLVWASRPFPFGRSVAVVLTCLALIIFACVMNAESRYAKGLSGKDRSVDNRLLIWKQVPSMIHDAPDGWGLGKSGDAYMQWYQPIGRGEGYRTLVNSHLTWLVELNWWGRIAYAASWSAMLALLWPRSDHHRWFSIPLAIWIAWGICASFSSVAEVPWLWIIPLTAFLLVIMTRFEEKKWPQPRYWLGAILASPVIMGGILLWGTWISSPSYVFSPHSGVVILGSKPPQIWVVAPDRNVLGEHYGQEVRRGYSTEPLCRQMGLGIVSELKSASQNQILVFSGHIPSEFGLTTPAQVILMNPNPVSADTVRILAVLPKVTVVLGAYSQNKAYWNEQARVHPNIEIQVVEGTEEYIPNWMSEVVHAIKG